MVLLHATHRILDLGQRAKRLESCDVSVQPRLREGALRIEVVGGRYLAKVALLRDDRIGRFGRLDAACRCG